MNKKIKLISVSVVSLMLIALSVLFLILQWQPIIKNQKYTLVKTMDGKECSITFDKNNKCYIYEDTKDYIKSYSRSYYQKGKYIDIYFEEKLYKNSDIENFKNGLFAITISSSPTIYGNKEVYTFMKPLWFLSASLVCFILAIISVCFLFYTYKDIKIFSLKQKLNELEKGE